MAATTNELATILCNTIKDETWSWHRFEAGKLALAHAGPWDEQELLETLEALFEAAKEQDETGDREGGRDSYYFDFYDCGFASMAEALRARLKSPDGSEDRK